MEKDLIGWVRWIAGAALAVQLSACGGKAVGCPIDAVDCSDDSEDPGQGGATQTGSTGFGGSLGLGGTGLDSGGQGGSSTGQGGSAQGDNAPTASISPAGGFGSGTTGEGNVTPAGFAGAGGSNGANSGTSSGSSSGTAGAAGSAGASSSAPQTAPPCPTVQPATPLPRPACVAATPVFPMGPSCTETWCNRPSLPAVVSCVAAKATLGDAYHYIINGDRYDASFSFDFDTSHSGEYPDQSTFLSVRLSVDVGVTDQGTPIVDRIDVPAALALSHGLRFVEHTIVGTLALRANDLDQSHFERPIYHAGCTPILQSTGLATPGECACGFAGIAVTIPIYVPLSRIP